MNDQETTVAQLRQAMARFVAERDWEQFHDAKNLAMSIAIEAAELMELVQWLRSDQLAPLECDPAMRQRVREELADVMCYVLGMANALGIDLAEAVRDKMAMNGRKYPADRFKGR